jgi:hypothetical protein
MDIKYSWSEFNKVAKDWLADLDVSEKLTNRTYGSGDFTNLKKFLDMATLIQKDLKGKKDVLLKSGKNSEINCLNLIEIILGIWNRMEYAGVNNSSIVFFDELLKSIINVTDELAKTEIESN